MNFEEQCGMDISNEFTREPSKVYISTDRLWEWLEEKIKGGALIELSQKDPVTFIAQFLNLKTLQPTKTFEGPTLLWAVRAAWEEEKNKVRTIDV